MSYSNPTHEATYTLPSGVTLINSTIALSGTTTVGDVYCQELTVADGALVSSSIVGNGGKIINSATMIKDINVQSGGSVNMLVAGKSAVNITAASGATLENCLANATRLDGTWNIASGVRFVHGAAVFDNIYTDARGYLLNFVVRGAVHIQNGMKIGNANINSYLYVNAGGEVSGGTVQKGAADFLRLNANGYAQDITVLSGGSVKFYGTYATLRDVVAEDGAKLTLAANNYLGGSKTSFSKGFLTNTNGGNIYAADGVLYNWQRLDFAAFYFTDITLSNTNATGQYLYLMNGAVARDTTIGAGNQTGIVMGKNADGCASAINTSAGTNGGYITVWNYQNECTFGGTSNDVAAGHIIIGAAGAGKANSSLSIADGNFSGLELKYNTTSDYLVKVKLIEGLNAQNAVVSSGGTLSLADGGSASDLTLNANGAVQVKTGGNVHRAVVSGGQLTVENGGRVDTLTVDGNAANGAVIINGRVDNLSAVNTNLVAGVVSVGQGAMLSGAVLSGTLGRNIITLLNEGRANDVDVQNGNIYINGSGTLSNLRLSGGQVIARGSGAIINGAEVVKSGNVTNGGELYVQNGGSAFDITVSSGGSILVEMKPTYAHGTEKNPLAQGVDVLSGGFAAARDGATIRNLRVSNGGIASASNGSIIGATVAGTLNLMSSGATMTDAEVLYGGIVRVFSGAVLTDAVGRKGGAITVDGGKLVDADISGRLNFYENKPYAILIGDHTNIAEGALFYEGQTAVSGSAEYGVLSGLNANGSAFKLSVGDGIVVKDAKLDNSNIRISAFDGASVDGAQVNAGAIICNVEATGTFCNVTLAGGQMNLSGTVKASRTIIENGGKLYVNASTASFDDTILKVGGLISFSAGVTGVDTGKALTLDFADTTGTMNVDLSKLANSTTIYATGVETVGTYTLGTGSRNGVTQKWGLYENAIAANGSYDDALNGLTYSFDGTAITTTALSIATGAAASLADATTINGSDKAAKWNSSTTYSANVFLAEGLTTGNAWLNIDGFANTAANLYGAAKNQNFAGTVNIGANNGTIKNLAAGAGLGGSVAGVKLTVGKDMNVAGAIYAGGMGDVTGKTETLVEGGTFSGNVFAGALCNYVANSKTTSGGDISLEVNGGTFKNNIYAGAAVKAGAAAGVVHTAGDITVELNDGTATKGAFCVYGGGYAVGTTANKVYTAGDVDITINGGSWGTYLSGRGIFGGVYADKVAASVDSVDIAVTGGTMGNIYGGGWAQNGGTSTVGDVSITVAGTADVANVFGGGNYSSVSYGATSVDNVTILIAGGNVANNVFAAGQGEYSTVTGNVSVTFTGSNDYACNVYGYGVQTSATSTADKKLTFNSYTGAHSGSIGGFDGITFTGNTAAALTGTIDNGDWTFDYKERTLDAGVAMLTLDAGSFTGDVAVDLSMAEQVAGGWSIATGVAAATATFGVDLSTGNASGLQLNDTLDSSYGVYEGWGFTLEDSTIKFKQLA